MPSVSLTFKKPNSALVMMPKVGKLTAISRKLFNVLLNVTQRQVAQFQKDGLGVLPVRFKAKLSDLVDPVEVGESNLLSQSKKSFREMRRVELDWEAPDANSEIIFRSMSLLSEVTFTKEAGKGVIYVEWAFPPSLMDVIVDPSRFTPIDITQLARLKTYTAVALYEIASRYRNNPSGLTSEQDMDWWISALSQSAAPIDPITKLPKPRGWSKFKDDSLNAAIQEINLKSDLIVELLEKKTGRKLTSAQFKVSRSIKDNDSSNLGTPSKMSSEIAEIAIRLGLSLGDISNLITQGQNENVLKVAFSRLEARLARDDLANVDSKIAYLRSVLTDTNQYVHDKPLSIHHVNKVSPQTLNDELKAPQSHKERRRAEIKDELMSLSKDQQKPYAETALEALRTAGLSTPSTKRKVEAGNWAASPFLVSKMVEAYAIAQYGNEWFHEPSKEA
ncbi:replication initiation protein [Polaromonas hydrogenivorans]|uniref:Replication initiation protein n=1 Tax=Polaromonas hydrogenivorans TaxID=335476 RepID=A0AAU7M0C7_9BURK